MFHGHMAEKYGRNKFYNIGPLFSLILTSAFEALLEADDDGRSKCACFVNSVPVTPFCSQCYKTFTLVNNALWGVEFTNDLR